MSSYPISDYVPERVEIPNKTTQLPNHDMIRRSMVTWNIASCKHSRIRGRTSSKTVNVNLINGKLIDILWIQYPKPIDVKHLEAQHKSVHTFRHWVIGTS